MNNRSSGELRDYPGAGYCTTCAASRDLLTTQVTQNDRVLRLLMDTILNSWLIYGAKEYLPAYTFDVKFTTP